MNGRERGGATLLNDALSISTPLGLDCPVLCLAGSSSFSQTGYKQLTFNILVGQSNRLFRDEFTLEVPIGITV